MSHLKFFINLIFSVSQTFSEKPNFLMFVIFLLTQPSALFARCGLLPATAIVPSCCPLPPLALPPLVPPPPPPPLPLSKIEAAHGQCALPHPTPQPPSAATVHSCCAPLPPPPPLPLSHNRCLPCHLPQLLCAVAAATAAAVIQICSTAVQRLPLLVFHQK